MQYAEVSVNSPAARRQTFSYRVPEHLDVRPGQAVRVPFGARALQGIVMALSPLPGVASVKDIAGITDPRPLLSEARLELANWISEYYLAPLPSAVALLLPPGFERRSLTHLSLASRLEGLDWPRLSAAANALLDLIPPGVSLRQDEAERQLGKLKTRSALTQLVNRGLVTRRYELAPPTVRARSLPYIYMKLAPATVREQIETRRRCAPKQAVLLTYLAAQTAPVPQATAMAECGADAGVIRALLKRGDIGWEEVSTRRVPEVLKTPGRGEIPVLTVAQLAAMEPVRASIDRPAGTAARVFLLHGVTASGKTEIYLQALALAVARGQRGIVLVPEISLTPQTIERFTARFPGRVAVLHSRLTPGEQYDEWHRIRDGAADVVIGPRSALFAPQPDLGLIVIDEEHEWSYKQQDQAPPYHAREVARKLAELSGATMILGSATPDVASYYRALRGRYELLTLPKRVTPRAESMPQVTLADMRRELKSGNRSVFSRILREALHQTLEAGEQAILFLNRRGGASFVQCRGCGHVFRCRRCDVTLTHHPDSDRLVCHQCHQQQRLPRSCPKCAGHQLDYIGMGTQKLERETAREFPGARLIRWDSDATAGRDAHREILDRFRDGAAEILIGTQMLAKGLDLPQVTLVGVVLADTSLYLPDFRAGERTFQLLTQVAGRAGRGTRPGQVVIQTYAPEHYAVARAAAHDYDGFYEIEIAYRRRLDNPPFRQLCRLIFSHQSDAFCREEAQRLKNELEHRISTQGIEGIAVLGPAPAFLSRRRGRYRWQIMLRGTRITELLAPVTWPRGWTVNIDPLGLA